MFYKDMGKLEEALGLLDLPQNLNSADIVAMYSGCQYTVNILDDQGLEFRGYAYKYKPPLDLLVVKATLDSVPVVCFVSGESFVGCFRIFFRLLNDRTIQWIPDKFA